MRKFGPRKEDGVSGVGKSCPACSKSFLKGQFTTLVSLGPGDDSEEQKNCREGLPYNAVATEVHWGCATGGK